jgi:hypothetical protein
MNYTYEMLLSLSDEEINKASANLVSMKELIYASAHWSNYYLDESDKAYRSGQEQKGRMLSEKADPTILIGKKVVAYSKEHQAKGTFSA